MRVGQLAWTGWMISVYTELIQAVNRFVAINLPITYRFIFRLISVFFSKRLFSMKGTALWVTATWILALGHIVITCFREFSVCVDLLEL